LLEQRLGIGEERDPLTRDALAAEVVDEAFAIRGLCEHARERKFSDTARAGEEQSVRNAFSAKSAAERGDDAFVAEKFLKAHNQSPPVPELCTT